MVAISTVCAEELSFREWHLSNRSALVAGFRRVSWVYLDELSTACYCFVGQHSIQGIP